MLSRLQQKDRAHCYTVTCRRVRFYGKGLVVEVLGRMTFGVGMGATRQNERWARLAVGEQGHGSWV